MFIYCGYHQTGQQVWLCSGNPTETGKEEDVQVKPGDKHSGKIYRRCESALTVFAEWPVIEVGEIVPSSNAPAGEGKSKSKSK